MRKNHPTKKNMFTNMSRKFLSLCILFVFFVGSAYAQININAKNQTVRTIIKSIEQQSDFNFFFNEGIADLDKQVSVEIKNKNIDEALKQLFANVNIAYKKENKTIVLTPAQKVQATRTQASTAVRQSVLKGLVVDKQGVSIVGATVLVEGTGTGTITNIDGEFSIEAPTNGKISVSYIGYIAQTIDINNRSQIRIVLEENTKELEELVVVGYGVQRRQSVTGALQTVDATKLKTITTPNVENMLNGKAPGVFVSPGTGQPGSTGTIIIRGKSTINGSTDPLWVIDGVIVGSSAGALNPNDIESLTILKDAASTAIYGSQGANGVILVTTKRAKTEKLSVDASVRFGASSLNNGNFAVMNGAELYDYYSKFSNAEQISFPRWNADLRNSNYSWWDLATQTGITQEINVTVSGGGEKQRSLFSLGVYDETGSIKGYDFKRYNFRYKTDYNINKWLTIKPQIAASLRKIDDRQYSVTSMYSNLPWDSPFDADGKIVPHRSSLWVNSNSTNYLYDLQWNKSNSNTYEFNGNLDFDIRFTKWLTFSSVNNYRYSGYSSSSYADPRSSGASGVNGRINEYQSNTVRLYTNQLLRFNHSFGSHNISALAAYEFNSYWGKHISAAGTGFIPGFEILDVTAKPESVGGGISEWAVQSLLSNVNYDYQGKYMAQFSLRRDGASNFGNENKYGNFFSISGAWNVHNEAFFNLSWMDNLKLRASYGSVGNRPNMLYPQYDLYSVSQSYNGNPGALISQIGNKNLTWEKTYTTGFGVDMTLLNRLRVNIDLYDKNTSNLLYPVPISGVTGVTSIWQNVGVVNNKGIEFSIGADIIKTKELLWSVDINIGTNKNVVEKLYGTRPEIIVADGSGIAGAANKLLRPGLDADTWYLREWAGVNPDNGAPQWYKTVKDANGNETREITSKYAEANEVVHGAYTPDFYGGFSTNLNYKNFDLSANFGYSVGGTIYNYSRSEYDSDGAYSDRNQMKLHEGWNRWEKAGDIATHPVASYNNPSNANKSSTRYLENGDYFKLRNLAIGYNWNINKYDISNIRIFVSGENLFTITNYSGVDPEISPREGVITGTTSPSVYPAVRKFVLGLNVTL